MTVCFICRPCSKYQLELLSVFHRLAAMCSSLRLEVLTVVLLKIHVFWGVTMYHSRVAPDVRKDRSSFILRFKQSIHLVFLDSLP